MSAGMVSGILVGHVATIKSLQNWIKQFYNDALITVTGPVAFSVDSKYVTAVTFDGKVNIWDVETGQVIRTLNVTLDVHGNLFDDPAGDHFTDRVCISLNREGSVLAFQSDDRKAVIVWDVAADKQLASLP